MHAERYEYNESKEDFSEARKKSRLEPIEE